MKYIVRFSGQFKKSFKLCKRRGYDVGKGLSVASQLFKGHSRESGGTRGRGDEITMTMTLIRV